MPPSSRGTSKATAKGYYEGLELSEVFADLASRFIINLPASELTAIERICFQVEESHWFYTDFIRPIRPDLPNFTLRRFSELFLISCSPHLSAFKFDPKTAYDAFIQYKTSVPVRGAILLNASLTKIVLVKGWKSGSGWGFPRGKINQDEHDRDCAVREVWEETSYDISPHFDPRREFYTPSVTNDVPPLLADDVAPETPDDYLELTLNDSRVRLYVITGVSEDAKFTPRTRKEISKIAFFPLKDLPGWHSKHQAAADSEGQNALGGKFFMVAPVMRLLKVWIGKRKGGKAPKIQPVQIASSHDHIVKSEDKKGDAQNQISTSDAPTRPAFGDLAEATRALQAFFLGGQSLQPTETAHENGLLAGSGDTSQRPIGSNHAPSASGPSDKALQLLNVLNAPTIPDKSLAIHAHASDLHSPVHRAADHTTMTEAERREKRSRLLLDLDALLPQSPTQPAPQASNNLDTSDRNQTDQSHRLLDMLMTAIPPPSADSLPSSAASSSMPVPSFRQDFSPTQGNDARADGLAALFQPSHNHMTQTQWPGIQRQEERNQLASLQSIIGNSSAQRGGNFAQSSLPVNGMEAEMLPVLIQQPAQPNRYSEQNYAGPPAQTFWQPNPMHNQISQPMPVRPINLLSTFTSPPPGPLPNIRQTQQHTDLLNLLNVAPAPQDPKSGSSQYSIPQAHL